MFSIRLLIYFLISLWPFTQVLAEQRSPWSFQGTIDANLFAGNGQESWLSGALGKYRVGDDDDSIVLHSAVALNYEVSLQSGFTVEAAYYTDPNHQLGLTQAFWHFKPLARKQWRSQYRVGAFHVPVSLENPGPLWHSRYTISPSFINTWVGEELRTIGAQGRWSWRASRFSPHTISFLAAATAANDTAGAMLSWRGWAAHNRQTLLGETIALPALPVIQPGNPFESQAPDYEPFVEVDDRIGYYAGISWRYARKIDVRYLYYDNRGDPLALVDGQYAWDTRFHHLGLKLKLSDKWTLISQFMTGNTIMGPGAVDNDFMSAHVLISRKVNHHRLSARIETFEVDDKDFLAVLDPNNESGERLTISYGREINAHWQVNVEASRIRSDRDYRELFGQRRKLTEDQALIQLRYRF